MKTCAKCGKPAGPATRLCSCGSYRFSGVNKGNAAVSYKPGRNAPCPCGSGKKYKRCCA